MIKDAILKAIGLPLLGVFLPLVAGMLCCPTPAAILIIASLCFFTGLSFLLWQGVIRLVGRSRNSQQKQRPYASRLLGHCLLGTAAAFVGGVAAAWLWRDGVLHRSGNEVIWRIGLLYAMAALLLVLVYENLFLAKERELDIKIVGQLDRERVQAELNTLKAELGPHFMFNSLTTLTHLIGVAPDTAQSYTHKLAGVYKYFLINKDRELISLRDELRFIEDYFFLLQIRYGKAVQLHLHVGPSGDAQMVIPCSLQLLVENAIKHNSFSDKDPLLIHIHIDGESVTVENEIRSKPCVQPGAGIGLNHLHQHYRLVCRKDIVVRENDLRFAVTVPLVKQLSL